MAKRILFIGNSITAGQLGSCYLDLIQARAPHSRLTNHGLEGDTLTGIWNRLLRIIDDDRQWTAVVVEAGHNDLLIPHLQTQDRRYAALAKRLQQRGCGPLPDPEHFGPALENNIRTLRQMFSGPLIITTLSCLGETLTSPLNLRRELHNSIIRRAVDTSGLVPADVGQAFDRFLAGKDTGTRLPKVSGRFFSPDRWHSRHDHSVSRLSRQRQLHLTIDGMHLNPQGARIYCDIISRALNLV